MKLNNLIIIFLTCTGVAWTVIAADDVMPERKMNVSQGPETVFDRDVPEIVPELKGAVATDENGRLGNELVFWGYRMADGESAFLYACAPIKDVDCNQRRDGICPVQTRLLTQTEVTGQISHFECEAVCQAFPGGVLPCCRESVENISLQVGLVRCQ